MPRKDSRVVLILEKDPSVQRMFCLFCNDERRIDIKIVSTLEKANNVLKKYNVYAIAIDGCLLEGDANTKENLAWIEHTKKIFDGPIIAMLCLATCNCRDKLLNMTADKGFIICTKEKLDAVIEDWMSKIYADQKAHH